MNTKFDIGDEIIFSAKGIVKAYSANKDGDCFTIEVIQSNKRSPDVRVYMSSEDLDSCNAEKVGEGDATH